MKKKTLLLCLLGPVLLWPAAASGGSAAKAEPSCRLTVDLRDGSRLVGQSPDAVLKFHSPLLGEVKLGVKEIRSIECLTTNSAKLTTANGDVLAVWFAKPELRLNSGFGRVELAVDSIRRLAVSTAERGGKARPGTVALWSGEGNADDVIGGNNMSPTDISFAEGKVGQAFSLNGSSSCARVAENSSLDVSAGDGLSITAWIKPENVSGFHPILEWNGGGELIGVQLWLGNVPGDHGVLKAALPAMDGNLHVLVSPPDTIVNGSFQHVAITYDKATGQGALYVNGHPVVRAHWGSFDPRTKGDIWLSRRPGDRPGDWTYNAFFSGLLDEVTIYNRALSQAELEAFCLEENNGEPLPAPSQKLKSWPFGGGFRGSTMK